MESNGKVTSGGRISMVSTWVCSGRLRRPFWEMKSRKIAMGGIVEGQYMAGSCFIERGRSFKVYEYGEDMMRTLF